MSNALTIIRSLMIYGLCLPLAIVLGYLVPSISMDLTSFIIVLLVLLLPLVPLMLRWHHFLLIASWNLSAVLFFLPGRPNVWIFMTLISLLLSILQHILNRKHSLQSVPSVARPLIFLFLVILVTAISAGGIGIKAFGSEVYGGRRYVLVLAAIIGFFAISCQRVPRGRESLYVSAFLLSGVTSVIGSMAGFLDPRLNFIFLLFPVESLERLYAFSGEMQGETAIRLSGLAPAGAAVVWYGLARYGLRGSFRLNERWHFLPWRIRGSFQINQPWRTGLMLLALWVSLQAGFRSAVLFFAIMFLCHFFLERLHRSRALPIVLLVAVLSIAIGLPMVSKMPPMVQRALSFLPVDIDPMIRMVADESTEWRLRIWQTVLPTVPRFLLVGKGYAIDPAELEMAGEYMSRDSAEAALVAGDYHNGPLTLLIPLGIWGAIGFLWFVGASFRVLLRNYRYGDPELRRANMFLFLYFLVKVLFFFFIFGSFHSDLFFFTGLVALSISVNGGVRGPVPVLAAKPAFNRLQLTRAARPIVPGLG
jgi:hypothetical protein